MNVNQYINTEVKPLSVNSLVSEVQELFKRLTFSHLPVTENDLLVGVLCEREIQALQTQNPIGQYNYALDSFFVKTDMWWIEVLEADFGTVWEKLVVNKLEEELQEELL